MLDMLPPGAAVQRIEVEGVASEDLPSGTSDERFVGVDVTEYEGGPDGRTARRVVLTQAKYSATHPDRLWNRARLVASPKPRRKPKGEPRPTSVLGKLATAYVSLRDEIARAREGEPGPEIVVRLQTNQPLDPVLRGHVEAIRRAGADQPPLAAGTDPDPTFALLPPEVLATRDALRTTTLLSDSDFDAFIRAWDLDAFSSGMLAAEEAALFTALTTYTSDAGVQVGNLLSFVQDRASAHRLGEIRRQDVLGLLRVTERDLWPAPPLLEPGDRLIETEDVRRLRDAIPPATSEDIAATPARPLIHAADASAQWTPQGGEGAEVMGDTAADVLVVHGPSGAGKTSTLRLIPAASADGAGTSPVLVLYDCFANGQGLEPRSARYPVSTCLTQVINELDAVLRTAILASARLDLTHLIDRFEKAVGAAAQAAARQGRRLVLAFDAVDNALHAAARAPVHGEPFVPWLWRIAWPRNCTVVVSARTENLPDLGVPDKARRLPLQGFTPDELARVGTQSGETDAEVLARLHSRTHGNPRVATRVLQALARHRAEVAQAPDGASEPDESQVEARLEIVDRTARENAFAYYREQTPERLAGLEDRATLAILAEATQSVDVGTLALLADRDAASVAALVERLAFGLRIDPGDVIAFRDQDFWDYVHEDFEQERAGARRALAEFVRAQYGAHPYAAANFSRHLYAAGEFDALVQWWLEEDRLARAIDAATPYVERAFEDVQYALLAASRTGRDADALTLLALGGDVVHGRDLFLDHLLERPRMVLALGALDEVLGVLDGERPDSKVVGRYAALAAAAAGDPAHATRVREILARVEAVRSAIYRHNEEVLAHRREMWGPRAESEDGGDSQSAMDAEDTEEEDTAELWQGVFGLDDISDEAVARARTAGTADALSYLSRFNHPEHLEAAYAAVVSVALGGGGAEGDLTIVQAFEAETDPIGPAVSREVALAVLASAAVRLPPADRDRMVKKVLAAAAPDAERLSPRNWEPFDEPSQALVRRALEALLAAGALDEARALAPLARRPGPRSAHDPGIHGFLAGEALIQALGLGTFDPDQYEIPGRTASSPPAAGGEAASRSLGPPTGQEYLAQQRKEEERRTLHALRTRLSAEYSAELLRARALVGVADPEQFLQETKEGYEGWLTRAIGARTDWNARWSAWSSVYPSVMRDFLEAIVRAPRRDAALVRAILDATDRVMSPGPERGLEDAARILSGDERYEAEAEYAISLLRRDARPPISRPAAGVDALLAAYEAASRFDETLAAELVREAREVANAVEAEIPGRAAGLAGVADRATTRDGSHRAPTDRGGGDLTPILSARRMVRLFAYLARVADEQAEVDVGEVLRHLARVDPDAAATEVTRLEKEEVLDVGPSVRAIAEGVIQGRCLPVDAAWPLAGFGRGVGERVYRAAVEAALVRGEPIEEALNAFATEACCRSLLSSRVETVTRFLEWADGLNIGGYPAVAGVREYATRLAAMPEASPRNEAGHGVPGAPGKGRSSGWQDPNALADAMLDHIRSLAEQSPAGALEALSECPDETLRRGSGGVLKRTFAALAAVLSSSRLGTLAVQAERLAEPFSVDAFLCLDEVARASRTPSVASELTASYRRLLTPDALRLLVMGYFREATKVAFGFPLLDDRARLRVIVAAAGERLAEFDAGTLYRLSGRLSELVSPAEAASMLDTLVTRAWARLPADVRASADAQLATGHGSEASPSGDPGSVRPVVRLLANLHGHPVQRVRWGAVHATVDFALARPELALELLVSETFDTSHPRWLTKREWLLFTLECVARRRPESLVPHAARIAEHALTKELPHAKIRHHAREVILAIGRAVPDALDAGLVGRIRAVNQPVGLVEPRKDAWSPVPARRETSEREQAWPDYHFDGMDTLPYWYQPLARVFDVTQDDIGDIAYEWIVRRWGITRSMVEAGWPEERKRLDYAQYSHRHGSEPLVEILERYADRHGLYMAAGTMIDTRAVVDDGPRQGDKWADWSRDHLREADPALTAHLLSPAPPETPEHYGRFREPYDAWRKNERIEDFRAELNAVPLPLPQVCDRETADSITSGEAEWLVIAAERSGSFSERVFLTKVEAALVSPRTAEAMQRLIHDSPREISVPEFNMGHDTLLAELEYDQHSRSDYYVSEQNVIRTRGGLFRFEPLFAACRPSLNFERQDPRWPESPRLFLAPVLDLVERLGLTRRETELLWRAPDGTPAMRCEVWFENEGEAEYSDQSEGARLLVRRDLLLEYARNRERDVLFVVTLRRSRSYRYRRYEEEKEDEFYGRDAPVAFRLRQDGTFIATPRGTRAPDEREQGDQEDGESNVAAQAVDPAQGDNELAGGATTREGDR
jgi:hypothetical protein